MTKQKGEEGEENHSLYKLAQLFKETKLPEYEKKLCHQLRLKDNIVIPLNRETASLILELPEEIVPYYTQCNDSIPLIVCRENYLNIIEETLRISKDSDIDSYLPKIYLIHKTNSVTIQNPWGLGY